MNRLLVELVIDFTAFLELSGDDVLNPDVAVSWLEIIMDTLLKLAPEERAVFRAVATERLVDARVRQERPKVQQFYSTFIEEMLDEGDAEAISNER